MNTKIKVLAEGSRFPVAEPFVFVAADAEAYGALRQLGGNLPALDAELFRSSEVVAAFAGQRPTPGYRIIIADDGKGSLRISEERPPADAILTQVLTAPYAVVAVPRGENRRVVLDETWRNAARTYNVVSGELASGGKQVASALDGSVMVLRHERLVTFVLEVRTKDGKRVLGGVVSTLLDSRGSFAVQSPPTGASASLEGRLDENGKKLTFKFRPPAAAQGKEALTGSVEAVVK